MEGSMKDFGNLMERLLELQTGERRSAKLIAEDERLMLSLKRRHLAGKTTEKVELSENRGTQQRFEV
jgi:hypothetical protein